MNKYKEALTRLSSIDLDYVLEKLGFEESDKISDYGMCDYPNLEKQGDIETLLELADKATPLIPLESNDGTGNVNLTCPKCRRVVVSNWYNSGDKPNYCPSCGQKLDWDEETCDDSVTCVDFCIEDIE